MSNIDNKKVLLSEQSTEEPKNQSTISMTQTNVSNNSVTQVISMLHSEKYSLICKSMDREAKVQYQTFVYHPDVVIGEETRGHNLYCYLNIGKSKGKALTNSDMTHCRGFVVDFDKSGGHTLPSSFHVTPTYILETSEGSYQVVWLFKEPIPMDTKTYQKYSKNLVDYYKGDAAVINYNQLIRLPGTINCKPGRDDFRGRLMGEFGKLLEGSVDDFMRLINEKLAKAKKDLNQSLNQSSINLDNEKFERILKSLQDIPQGYRWITFRGVISLLAGLGVSEETIRDRVTKEWLEYDSDTTKLEALFKSQITWGQANPIVEYNKSDKDDSPYKACVSLLTNQGLQRDIFGNTQFKGEPLPNDKEHFPLLLDYLRQNVYKKLTSATADEAFKYVLNVSEVYNPIRKYYLDCEKLELPERSDYLGELFKRMELNSEQVTHITMWLVGLVRVGLKPGTQMDTTLVLIGEGGIGKNTFLGALLPSYFQVTSVAGFNPENKDDMLKCIKSGLVVLDEISSTYRKADLESLKSLLTQRVILLRQPYGRNTLETKRHWAYAATSNDMEVCNDPTGSRRFIPIELKTNLKLAIEYLENNRDYIIKELVNLALDPDYRHWYTQEELKKLEKYQEPYSSNTEHPIDPYIFDYFGNPQNGVNKGTEVNSFLSSTEMEKQLREVCGCNLKSLNKITVGRRMKYLGAEDYRTRDKRGWVITEKFLNKCKEACKTTKVENEVEVVVAPEEVHY